MNEKWFNWKRCIPYIDWMSRKLYTFLCQISVQKSIGESYSWFEMNMHCNWDLHKANDNYTNQVHQVENQHCRLVYNSQSFLLHKFSYYLFLNEKEKQKPKNKSIGRRHNKTLLHSNHNVRGWLNFTHSHWANVEFDKHSIRQLCAVYCL